MEQLREGVSGDGLEGTSGKRDSHRASSRNLNVSTDEAVTISSCSLFQYVHKIGVVVFAPEMVDIIGV